MLEILLVERLIAVAPNLYPLRAPKNYATPAVVYNRINTTPVDDLDGVPSQASMRVQIDVYDPDYATAKTLAKSIRDNLVAWQDVQCTWTDERDMIDETTEVTLYRVMLQFSVFASV